MSRDFGMRGTPKAARTATLASLTRWKRRLPGIKHAVLPSLAELPNPVLAGRTLIVSAFSPGAIFALDAGSGAVRWRKDLGALAGATTVACGPGILAKTAHELFCLDRRTGHVRWSFCPYGRGSEQIYSTPIVCEGRVVVADRRGWVHALDLATGAVCFSVNAGHGAQVNATPAYDGHSLYLSSNAGDVFALDPRDGTQRWRRAVPGASIRRPRLMGSLLVVPTVDNITFLRPSTGTLHSVWRSAGSIVCVTNTPDRLLIAVRGEHTTGLVGLKNGKVASDLQK